MAQMSEIATQQSILLALGRRRNIKLTRINVIAGKMNGGRFVRSAPKGFPDIIGVLNTGRAVAIEVKSKAGKLTKEQQAFRETFERMNGLYILARTVEDAVSAVDEATIFAD